MRLVYLIFSATLFSLCANAAQNQALQEAGTHQEETNPPAVKQSSDTGKWTHSFLEFSKAIINNDRKAVKAFIDFPIKNKGNEIWYLGDSKLVTEIKPNKIVPFTESDLDKYYSSIFAFDFRNTLQKLNLDSFFIRKKASSPELEIVKGSKSKLEARYDKAMQKLTLALVTIITGQKNTKFTIYYKFDVLNNQDLKFRGVHVE